MGGFCFVNVWTLATINVQQIDLFSCQVYVLKGLFQPGRSYDSTPGLQFLTAESWCQTQTSPLLWLQESQFFVGQGTFSSSSGSFGCALCVCASALLQEKALRGWLHREQRAGLSCDKPSLRVAVGKGLCSFPGDFSFGGSWLAASWLLPGLGGASSVGDKSHS